MGPSAVVKAKIAPDGGAGLRDTGVGMQVDLFIFDGSPKPFDEDVVAPCAFAIHTDLDLAPGQHLDEVGGGELAALDALLTVKGRFVAADLGLSAPQAVVDLSCDVPLQTAYRFCF